MRVRTYARARTPLCGGLLRVLTTMWKKSKAHRKGPCNLPRPWTHTHTETQTERAQKKNVGTQSAEDDAMEERREEVEKVVCRRRSSSSSCREV